MVKPTRLAKQARCIRKQTYITVDEARRFEEIVAQTGLSESEFLRSIALGQAIRPKRARHAQDLIHELHTLGTKLNRVGNNVNQIAKNAHRAGYTPDAWGLEADLEALRALVVSIVEAIKKV